MLSEHLVTGSSLSQKISSPSDSSNSKNQDIWVDALDHVDMEDSWFDASEEHHDAPTASARKAADSRVPFTQDCRRGIQQLVSTLGRYGESKMLSAWLANILPDTPTSLVIAANSLYTAITERRHIDTAVLHALGLASAYLPDNVNVVSRLAAFIRESVSGWMGDTFLQQFVGEEENPTSTHLFTALAITAIVAGRWMKDEGAAQRGLLRVPAFMANIFIRASHYWTALENMARALPSGEKMPENSGPSPRTPAFEVDSVIEMTDFACDPAVCGKSLVPWGAASAPTLTAFSSNSTADLRSYTRAIVQNKPAPTSGENNRLSEPEWLHSQAVNQLRQLSGLSDLAYCETQKTESRQQVNEDSVTTTHFKTQCDAIASPQPFVEVKEITFVSPDVPEKEVTSSGSGRSGGDALLPLMMTAAITPAATSYLQAMKSKSVMTTGAVVGLTGLAVAGKRLWDNSRVTRTELKEVVEVYDKPTGYHGRSRRNVKTHDERTNYKVKKLLFDKKVLNRKTISKAKLLYAVSVYLNYNNEKNIQSVKNTKSLARKILSGSHSYGGGKNEKISIEQAKSVVRSWIIRNIIGTSPEEYIRSQINSDMSSSYTVDDISHLLDMENLPATNGFNPERLSQSEKLAVSKMWRSLLMEEMPFLSFNDKIVKQTLLSSYDFANLYSGSRFLKDIKSGNFTSEEAISTGEAMWSLAVTEGISQDKIKYYLAPAIYFYLSRFPKVTKEQHTNNIEVINHYINYREEVSEVQKDINEKYNKYLSDAGGWLSKGKLADFIISQCRFLPIGIPNQGDDTMSMAERRKKAESYAKQKYLNGSGKPCKGSPVSLNDEYSKQTANVADSFREIDKYLVFFAISQISGDEKEFILSSDAKIYVANAYIQMMDPGSSFSSPKHYTERTDLISVIRGKEERVYALKHERNGNDGYKFIRVDRDAKEYITKGLFGDFLNDYKVTWDKIEDSRDINTFGVTKDASSLNGHGDNFEIITDAVSEKHRDDLYNNLYEAGNDKSDIQKIWNVVKHFIPFYDCIVESINKNVEQAVPACLIDAVSFIPVFGKAASLSAKSGMGLARGLRKGAVVLVRAEAKAAAKNVPGEMRLPTTAELASLGKMALRSADPGFEVITDISRWFGRKIVKLLSASEKTAALAKTIDMRIAELRHTVPDTHVMGKLPDSELEVPLEAIKKRDGVDIYVQLNPETGERFGKKYVLDSEGALQPYVRKKIKIRKKTDISFNPCTGSRHKRNVDELCTPAKFRPQTDLVDDTIYPLKGIDGNSENIVAIELARFSALERHNPVRAKYIRKIFKNCVKVSDAAILNMRRLSDADLVNFVKENLKITISEANAAVLRKNIQELNSAIKVMNNEIDSRVFIALRSNDKAIARYSSGEGFIIIDEFFFYQPVSNNIITVLHESSHATGMDDFIYLKSITTSSEGNSYKSVETYKELRQYTAHLTKKMEKEGVLIQVEPLMNDLRKDLSKPQMEKYLKAKHLKISKYELPSDLERGFVNSPDTTALTTLFLSGETKAHFFKKNILNLKDVSGIVSNSHMARDFSKDLKSQKITGLK